MLSMRLPCKRLLVSIILLFGFNEIVFAQGLERWSDPERIPGLGDNVWTPYIVADQNRTVHAFVSDSPGDENDIELDIYYSNWTLQIGWTDPIDIILAPMGQARIKGVYLDQNGIIHLIFFAGDDLEGGIYYSTVSALNAGNVRSWSEPVLIGPAPITPDEAAIAGDGQGNIYVVYAGRRDSHGLYFVYSDDSGGSWSDLSHVDLTYRWDRWPTHLWLYVDNSGDLHALWSIADTSGNSLAVYYKQLDADQMVWADTVELAEAIGFEADTPSIIEHDNQLFVIYHNDSPTTRWMRRSTDDGQSWTEPIRLFPHVGSNGPASLVVDGLSDLHMFFGNRIDATKTQGMWHSVWLGNRWSDPEAIVSGPGGPGFDPARPRSVVSQGNTIFVSWQTEPGQDVRGTASGAWYSYLILDAPELPLVPFEPGVVFQTVRPTEEAAFEEAPQMPSETDSSPEEILDTPQRVATDSLNNNQLIIFGILPAVLLSAGILISNRFRQ